MEKLDYTNIVKNIIYYNYSDNHNFNLKKDSHPYQNLYEYNFVCNICSYEILVHLWDRDIDYGDNNKNDYNYYYYSNILILNYFGNQSFLNDYRVDIISCDEQVIKNILE